MRAPQARSMKSARATQPSTPPPAARTTGPQGSPGGTRRKPGLAGRQSKAGLEVYLWVLVLIELALTGGLRRIFKRVHGG